MATAGMLIRVFLEGVSDEWASRTLFLRCTAGEELLLLVGRVWVRSWLPRSSSSPAKVGILLLEVRTEGRWDPGLLVGEASWGALLHERTEEGWACVKG